MIDVGNDLVNFAESGYYAFPTPEDGIEVMWNQQRRTAAGNKLLYPVEHSLVAITHSSGLQRKNIRARMRFGEANTAQPIATGKRAQKLLFLGSAAITLDIRHIFIKHREVIRCRTVATQKPDPSVSRRNPIAFIFLRLGHVAP